MLTSGLAVTALLGVYVIAVLTPTGQAMEDSILRSVDGETLLQSGSALDAISPSALLLVVGVTMLVAFARRRPGAALQAGALVVGATVTTQVLKIVVPRPELTGDVYANSFPSGHTTVAVAAMFAVLTAFGRRSRPVVYVVATAFAAIVAEQTVAYGWHRCSDVVGVVRGLAARYTPDRRGRDESVGSKAHGVTSGVLGLALVVCLAASGATWGIGIGSDMSVTTSTGDGVLMGARLAAAGVVLVTGWLAWKLDRRL
jgi:hypothetical protein